MSRRTGAALLALVVPGLLSGCGGTSVAGAGGTTSSSPVATATPARSGPVSFGETHTWGDGLAFRVSEPTRYRPGRYVTGRPSDRNFALVTVSVTNGTGRAWDPGALHVTATTGRRGADDIFDHLVGQGLDWPVQAGRTARFKMAFGVVPHRPFVVTVDAQDLRSTGKARRAPASWTGPLPSGW